MSYEQTQESLRRADEQLDALVDIAGGLRVRAGEIGHELNDQKHMLEHVDGHMDKAGEEVVKATTVLQDVSKHKATCCAWIIAVIFLIGTVVILVLKW